jgi:LPXTG-motif cell wall-anchored protein
MNFTTSKAGTYEFVFINFGQPKAAQMKAAQINFEAGIVGRTTTATVSSVIVSVTRIVTSIGSSSGLVAGQALEGNMWLVALALVLVLAAILLYWKRSKTSHSKTNIFCHPITFHSPHFLILSLTSIRSS